MSSWLFRHMIIGVFVTLVTYPAYCIETLCVKGEQNYFSCKSGSRIISLCASNDLSATKGYLQFRLGRRGHIEIAYPAKDKHPKGLFRHTHENATDGVEMALHFNVGEIMYSVFTTETFPSPTRNGAINHGLRLSRDQEFIREIPCSPKNPETIYFFDIDGDFFRE